MNNLLNKKVKVHWNDAVIYKASSVKNPRPTAKVTKGVIVKESQEGIVVGDPYTTNEETGERDSREMEKKATFLFIPHGMIKKIE
jgi:hypothetical protein